jgi:ribosomal protein L29
MKKNQLNEFKSYDTKALKEAVKKAKMEVADLVLDKNMSKLSDLKVISKKRRDIAQMSTILNQKILIEKLEGKVTEKGAK